MPVLDARLLGTPRFAIDGREVDLGAGKVRALYAYLVASRQLHSRDRLASFFWPDVRERNALASLRTALYELRRGLGDEATALLRVERSRVGLPTDIALELDLAHLEAVGAEHGEAELETLGAAVEAYGGPFLEGVSLPDAYDFDDWVFVERERLANLYVSALCRLGEQFAGQRDFPRAIDMARRVLAIDPLREEIHRALMRYLALDGQRAAALAQYRSCAEQLQAELGIQPLGATTSLYRHIADDEPLEEESASPSALSRAAASRARKVHGERPRLPRALRGFDGPVIGRDAEAAALGEVWLEAVEGRGRLVLVSGEAGVGKTRLAATAASAAGDGATVLLGRCYESATHEPFGPVIAALRGAAESIDLFDLDVPGVWMRELARLLPELGEGRSDGEPVPLDGIRDRDRLFEAVRAVLGAIAEHRPVLWVVDDLQWADETSVALLAYLARTLDQRRMMILATSRDEDVSESRRTQLRQLRATGLGIDLRRLSSAQTAELIGSLAGEQGLPSRLGRRLHERTGGNPFFVVETLRALFEQGSLRSDEGGRWTTTSGAAADDYDDLPVPESVGLIVDARLERLEDSARAVADAAAALRRDFEFEIVQRATGLGAAEALDGLDALLSMGVLHELPGDGLSASYDFNHALVRDRIYGRLSGARRQHLHRQLAGLLEATGAEAPERVAYHYLRGGVRDRACTWSMRAGRAALAMHAAEDALAHFGTARQLSVAPQEEFLALSGLGDAHVALGAPEAAVGDYREALTVAAEDVSRADILRCIGRAHDRQGDYDAALTAFEEARQLLRGTSEVRSLTAIRLADGTATVYIRIGRVDQATALCRDALVLLEMSDLGEERHRAEAWVRNTLGMARLHAGDYAEAERHLARSLELKRELEDKLGEATLLNNLGVVHYHCGDDMEALRHYARSLRIKREIGDHYGSAIALTNLSLIETHLGRLQAAADHLVEAERAAGEVGASWLVPEIRRVDAQRALALGELDVGLAQAKRSLEAAEELGVPAFIGVAHRVLGQAKSKAYVDGGVTEDDAQDAAEEHFRTSVAVFEMLADRHELAKTHAAFGEALWADGRQEEAADLLRLALQTFRDSGAHGRAKRVARLLGEDTRVPEDDSTT